MRSLTTSSSGVAAMLRATAAVSRLAASAGRTLALTQNEISTKANSPALRQREGEQEIVRRPQPEQPPQPEEHGELHRQQPRDERQRRARMLRRRKGNRSPRPPR